MKVYSHTIDGAPEIKRPFLIFRECLKKYCLFTRCDKEEILQHNWGGEKDHVSSDGEFYADACHNWIYPIEFEKYVYADELNLK